MGRDDDFVDEPLTAEEGQRDISGALAVVALAAGAAGGPVAFAAASAALLLERARARLHGRQGANAEAVIVQAAEQIGPDADALLTAMVEEPRRLALLVEACNAAAESVEESRIAALAAALASGALAEDDARVDAERVWVRVMRDIEPPHLRLLLYLKAKGSIKETAGFIDDVPDMALIHNNLAVLVRHGLVSVESHQVIDEVEGGGYESRTFERSWSIEGFATNALLRRFPGVDDAPPPTHPA